ncbi:protein-arginine N-methyltransferase SFM1 [Sporobolomyces salmoneus]|uniref:protein-arginine N-methyltransferase SFM1 n=1 Tax=Sporobolomyces salmoneus TaxID=183962 RepID=UPI003170043E
MPTYVIEHMEDDNPNSTFPHWIALEYAQMLRLSAPSTVIFSSLSPSSVESLRSQLLEKGMDQKRFRVETKSVRELMQEEGVELGKVCLLDPRAEKVVGPEDGGEFDWFLFGGILGDDPPRDRTGILRKDGYPSRHLGPVQMTTDTALGVTKLCVQDFKKLDEIKFVDHPTIKFPGKGYENESVEMPFRYVVDEKTGEPILPEGMREHLRDDMDRELDDF